MKPALSWRAHVSPQEEEPFFQCLFGWLAEKWTDLEVEQDVTYFLIPIPRLRPSHEDRLIEAGQGIDVFVLEHGALCYKTSDTSCFRKTLSHLMNEGPPELTVIAARNDALAAALSPAAHIQEAAQWDDEGRPPLHGRIGMHFDSFDLMSIWPGGGQAAPAP